MKYLAVTRVHYNNGKANVIAPAGAQVELGDNDAAALVACGAVRPLDVVSKAVAAQQAAEAAAQAAAADKAAADLAAAQAAG